MGKLTATANGFLSVKISSTPRERQRFTVPLKTGGSIPVVFDYAFEETLRRTRYAGTSLCFAT